MPRTATPPAENPADFDEYTPPPRRRPVGTPAPRRSTLHIGESPVPTFLDWDANGRIPAGSVLARFVGADLLARTPPHSGYELVALPADPSLVPADARRVGRHLPRSFIGSHRIAAEIVVGPTVGSPYCVLAPRE